jgi:RNA polymerase sigma-70 factor (ECF subfamily)
VRLNFADHVFFLNCFFVNSLIAGLRLASFFDFCNKTVKITVFLYEKFNSMAENLDLQRVVEGCKNGSNESFSQLVDIFSGRCYKYYYRLTGNRELSDDLLSELFVRLVEKIKTYRGGSFESWLFKTASNLFFDHLRDKQRQQKVFKAGQNQLEEKLRYSNTFDNELVDELQQQLDKLDADTKELILLRFYSGLSFKELSELRSEPIGTVLSKVHRGFKKLREFMEH